MANTTWSATDQAGVTLSGTNNLTATTSTAAATGVRTIDKQNAGKYYFEYTVTTWGSVLALGVGIATGTAPFGAGTINACCAFNTGQVNYNGTNTGQNIGATANGGVICIALDLTNKLVWFRSGAAGNWNGNATYNPATGVGGISIASIAAGIIPVYGFEECGSSVSVVTANFGDSAFSGAVPSGFTSGFTSGAVIPTNELLTQIGVEEWGVSTPSMQLTQIGVEEWGAPNAQLQATQTALEHWARASSASLQLQATQTALEQWATIAIQSIIGPAYALTASRAGLGSAIGMRTTTRSYATSLPSILNEAPITIVGIAGNLTGVAATGIAGTISVALVAPIAPVLAGVAAISAVGTLAIVIPRIVPLAGVAATGMAQAVQAYAGPAVFLVDVYATGVPGILFAIAGGVVKRYIFFMGGVF